MCKGKHQSDQKCSNCTPDFVHSYRLDKNCLAGHKPYPKGQCSKCLPATALLKRQDYRHIDYVSFMNYPDLEKFVARWRQKHQTEQRMAWLYGYYSEDPNFPEGVRVNIEALYEPPQIGEFSGFHVLQDDNEWMVNAVAESLSLEKVGQIYTTIDGDSFIHSDQIRNIANY